MSALIDLPTESAFQSHVDALPASTLLILSFHAPWAAPCAQMRTLLTTLAGTYPATTPPRVSFVVVDAEELPDVSERYDVTAVPFLVLQRSGTVLERISGCDAARVRAAVERHVGGDHQATAPLPPQLEPDPAIVAANQAKAAATAARETPTNGTNGAANGTEVPVAAPSEAELHARLATLVKAAPVMLFMKGTPSAPQCGFSRQRVALLRGRGVRYGFFNILADEDVRQGLKTWADWPTFPQLWMDGELVGGLDIVSIPREDGTNTC